MRLERLGAWRGATASVALMLASSCQVPAEKREPTWTYTPEGYVSASNIADSYMRKDGVLLHARGDFGGALTRLDASTGTQMWSRRADWAVHPAASLDPLWIADATSSRDVDTLTRVDAQTGKDLRVLALPKPISSMQDRLVYASGRVLALSMGKLRAINLTTGEDDWTAKLPSSTYLHTPVVVGDTVIYLGDTYVGIDARTGAETFRFEGVCCSAAASPDGKQLYLRADTNAVARVDWEGNTLGALTGDVHGASNEFVVVSTPSKLEAFEHGSNSPAWSLPTTNEAFVSGVQLEGDQVFYFFAGDDFVWRRDLGKQKSERVLKLHGHFVVSPDATGASSAFLSTPPQWDAPYLFVWDWGLRAYKLPPG